MIILGNLYCSPLYLKTGLTLKMMGSKGSTRPIMAYQLCQAVGLNIGPALFVAFVPKRGDNVSACPKIFNNTVDKFSTTIVENLTIMDMNGIWK